MGRGITLASSCWLCAFNLYRTGSAIPEQNGVPGSPGRRLSREEAPGGRRAPAGSGVWDGAALTSQDVGSSEPHTRPVVARRLGPRNHSRAGRSTGWGPRVHTPASAFPRIIHPIPGTAHFLEEAQSHGLACVCLRVNTYKQAGLETDVQTSENPSSRLVSPCGPG